jgi:hypothetical protein
MNRAKGILVEARGSLGIEEKTPMSAAQQNEADVAE